MVSSARLDLPEARCVVHTTRLTITLLLQHATSGGGGHGITDGLEVSRIAHS